MRISWVFVSLIGLLFVSGCTSQTDEPTSAIENYIQALVDQDGNRLANLSCAEWEADAQIELESFSAVSVSLEELSCRSQSEQAGFTLVACTGKIIANYGNEVLEINLEDQVYRAIFEGGEWRMCGYQ